MTAIQHTFGSDDAEIERLELLHRAWRASTLELWQHARIREGMTILDAGAGAGAATFELSKLAGEKGRVIAVERSAILAMALSMMASGRNAANVAVVQSSLTDFAWPEALADVVWCRFGLCHVCDAVAVVCGMVRSLKPGGVIVLQDAFDCGTWRLAPQSAEFESYVTKMMADRRADGAEPDIGLALPAILQDAGLTLELVRPVVFAAHPGEPAWQWPAAFVRINMHKLMSTNMLSGDEASALSAVLSGYEARGDALMLTPGVLQIVARKPL
jgi:SAM-dependent methyltransferase